jgi:RNA polymerase sigma factor for flagellar operon FliA
MGVPFQCYASRKALFLAVDEMRRARILRHASAVKRPSFVGLSVLGCDDESLCALAPACPDSDRQMARLEAKDTLAFLLAQLDTRDRLLLMLYYADGLNFREMGVVLGLSESGVCLRHKSLLARLRHLAGARHRAGLGEALA